MSEQPPVRKLAQWAPPDRLYEPDPELSDYIQQAFTEALALFEPEAPRLPETDLGVLIWSSLSLAYFAEYDRQMVKVVDPVTGRLVKRVDPVVGWGTGEVLGFLGVADEVKVITTREELEYAHVRHDLVPLVREAASAPAAPPPPPPDPFRPPYPSCALSLTDRTTGVVGSRSQFRAWAGLGLTGPPSIAHGRGWGKT